MAFAFDFTLIVPNKQIKPNKTFELLKYSSVEITDRKSHGQRKENASENQTSRRSPEI